MATEGISRPARRVLVIQHQRTCPVGRVGLWLRETGADLDVRRPYLGDALPTELTDHAGLVVLGGEMGHRDDDIAPWLPAVRELIRAAAKGGTPTLGICLGHQIAADALGGQVGRGPSGRNVGLLAVRASDGLDGDPVFAGCAGALAVHWNDDVVTTMPKGALALAVNDRGDLFLARYADTVWGVQGHPEADQEILRQWAEKDIGSAALAGVDIPSMLDEVRTAQPAIDASWRPVVGAFAALM